METSQAERLIEKLDAISKDLKRIAEVNKVNLWFVMERQATKRQKEIISDVLKKL